ncbi:MAG: transcription antitermination factor NusB [Cytophagales bacterium]|nr:transcription antitermination factor NusB [Cytophagales bacterium]
MINRRTLRVKVLQLLYSFSHQSTQSDDVDKLQLKISQELDTSITGIEKNFFDLLSIPIIFKKINEEKREIAKSEKIKKSNSRFNLSDNKVVNFLERNTVIIDGLIKYKNQWNKDNEDMRVWYKLLLEEDFYKDYILIESPSFEDDYNFCSELLLKFLLKNEIVKRFFEENNIFWNEDFLIVRSMLKKTVKSMNSSNFNTFAVASLSEDIKEDLKFASSLFDIVVQNTSEYDKYIKKYAKNWDLERITLMDRSILRMGIGEMTSFSNIPVKVTINECIDIAKNYSSPKSGKFINGLLDVISLNLHKESKIIKSGKGLIDNK